MCERRTLKTISREGAETARLAKRQGNAPKLMTDDELSEAILDFVAEYRAADGLTIRPDHEAAEQERSR